ncbi:cupin domain-containing protein [Synechococcus sp. CC9311]|uniref:cupin domain-containing protein n=1 Tax=Synechococcus sp. (strain CC9311) TaxID=64471 RepID=UPI0000DDAF5A|nr:cupin domain-containing protein [Synechococcus sp. CC9311]ABI47353.1 conserved hypothetical protein [Synechococcus sp. CC9311]
MQLPTIKYWRVWVNEMGASSQSLHAFDNHQQSVFAQGAAPIWNARHSTVESQLVTLILMPGDVFEWHENPVPQWIMTLRGHWAVKTMDGTVVEMGPGDISFGGDQGTFNQQGHCSWCIGDLPAELLLVHASEPPSWNPC